MITDLVVFIILAAIVLFVAAIVLAGALIIFAAIATPVVAIFNFITK